MALKVDDTSVKGVLRLKHYKDFCAAFKALTEPDQIRRVKEFRTKFNELPLPDGEEKEWLLNVTTTVAATNKRSIAEILDWIVALRKVLNNVQHTRVRDAIQKFGVSAVELFRTFGANANFVHLQKLVTTLPTDPDSWLQSIPVEARKLDSIDKCLTGLKSAKFTDVEIQKLWTQFTGVDTDALWAVMMEHPETLYAAQGHLQMLEDPAKFWMKGVQGAEKKHILPRVASFCYAEATWKTHPKEVNAIALELTATPATARWLKFLGMAELVQIEATLKIKELKQIFFGKADQLADHHPEREKAVAFGKWLSLHCDLIVDLVHHGYTDLAIVAMFEGSFGKWLIIACTWFPRLPVAFTVDDITFFRATGVNGGLIGRRGHLARRHLYLHFDFSEIKLINSFHPHKTTIEAMVKIVEGLTLPDGKFGLKQVGSYNVMVGEETVKEGQKPNPHENEVISFYPNLPDTHIDYFSSAQLLEIQKVLNWIPAGNRPIAWR